MNSLPDINRYLDQTKALIAQHQGFEYLQTSVEAAFIRSAIGLVSCAPVWLDEGDIWRTFSLMASDQGGRLDRCHPFAGGFDSKRNLRWHCCIPPLAQDGSVIAIRQMQWFSTDDQEMQFLASRLAGVPISNYNLILIAGPTGAGKTTLLHALLKQHFLQQRVIIIESIPELNMASPYWSRLTSRDADIDGFGGIAWSTVVSQALRLSPDQIVIGEIRSDKWQPLLALMQSGHGAVWTTIHADDGPSAWQRLRNMTAGVELAASLRVLVLHLDRNRQLTISEDGSNMIDVNRSAS